ncbi:hypothetical protein PV10_05612 [Exophiala mesophila]|uniref:Acyltransferase MbtK/IucB-like conserved domain-containing protein n=1 Tax=Exophiala mesophila TaxID=212818 RepID=A0A0D1Z8L1_EXOME|nr:uncharacterized protein PV10_05612 [Exophiala mesophila]KIV91022.1 hypothetical protein PV10_05612 [Exophiala mesophila]
MAGQKATPLAIVRLPEPWKTTYEVQVALESEESHILTLQLSQSQLAGSTLPSEPLHNDTLYFSNLVTESNNPSPQSDDNSPWARFHQSQVSYVSWDAAKVATVGQLWNLIHAIVTMYPSLEGFRLALKGPGSEVLSTTLQATGIAIPRPRPSRAEHKGRDDTSAHVYVSRSAFWQGAASPFGSRPAWVADPGLFSHLASPLESFPAFPLEHTVTFSLEGRPVHAQHPVRSPKPTRGATIYSRYMPHLDEFFSMVHLDYKDDTHLQLFHTWQNDPRVSQGWNETGTLEQHREYLRKIDQDPHQMAVLARFDDVFFAYFEIYWAKEDHMGVYLSPAPGDYDRGRHSLVGDARYRGPHRAAAWWTSLIHYLFLDEPRTVTVVGEPKATNANVLAYDAANGFHIHKLADLPHKRSAIVRCERLRFFQTQGFGGTAADVQFPARKQGSDKGRNQLHAKL